MRCRRIRRQGGALTAIAVIAFVIGWSISPAGATVLNPGTSGVLGGLSVSTTAFVTDAQHQIGVLASGTVDSDGAWTIPFNSTAFGSADVVVTAPGEQLDGVTLHVTVTATSDWVGDIQPDQHAATLFGNGSLLISADGLFTNCAIGPFGLNLQTDQPGGSEYDATTGTATLADDLVSLPALSPSSAECSSWENRINRALDLPSVSGSTTISLSVSLNPPPISSPLATTTTTTTTTSSTAPPTSTTPTSDTSTTGSSSPTTQGDTTTSGAAATTGGTAGSASTTKTSPKPTAAAKPNAKPKAKAKAKPSTTKPPQSTTTTSPWLEDGGAVITPVPQPTVPPTDAPKPDAVRIPDNAQPVSNRLPSGVLIFGLALLLGGIGLSLISSEIRKFVQPRHRPRLH